MSSPEQKYRTAANAHNEARAHMQKVDADPAIRDRSVNWSNWEPSWDDHLVRFHKAEVELERAAAAYNRSAPDLEVLRVFLTGAIETASKEFAAAQVACTRREVAAPPGVFTGGLTVEALRTHVAQHIAANDALAAPSDGGHALARRSILRAYRTALEAWDMVKASRKVQGLPAPTPVADESSVPDAAPECAAAIAKIEAQRVEQPRNGLSAAEIALDELEEKARAYEASRIRSAAERARHVGTYANRERENEAWRNSRREAEDRALRERYGE